METNYEVSFLSDSLVLPFLFFGSFVSAAFLEDLIEVFDGEDGLFVEVLEFGGDFVGLSIEIILYPHLLLALPPQEVYDSVHEYRVHAYLQKHNVGSLLFVDVAFLFGVADDVENVFDRAGEDASFNPRFASEGVGLA